MASYPRSHNVILEAQSSPTTPQPPKGNPAKRQKTWPQFPWNAGFAKNKRHCRVSFGEKEPQSSPVWGLGAIGLL